MLLPEKERTKEQTALLARAYIDATLRQHQLELRRLRETLSQNFWIDTSVGLSIDKVKRSQ